MNISFATCDTRNAINYIKQVYPKLILDESKFPKVIKLISNDVLRVQDPMMYGNRIAIVAGNNYKKDQDDSIKEATDELLSYISTLEPTTNKGEE